MKNGFYAFESALLVRPFRNAGIPLGVLDWNVSDLWKSEYGGGLDDVICFAEDLFGGQFGLTAQGVVAVDPETAEREVISNDLEGWAKAVLNDVDFRTGRTMLRDWESLGRTLAPGYRLAPKVPFVTGGGFEVDNLYAAQDVAAMRFRGSIAQQISDVPDGGYVKFEIKDQA